MYFPLSKEMVSIGYLLKRIVPAVDSNLGLGDQRGSVVECLTRDRGAAGSSLTGVTVLCP